MRTVGEKYGKELETALGRALPEFRSPLRRYSHGEAVKIVNSLGCRNPARG